MSLSRMGKTKEKCSFLKLNEIINERRRILIHIKNGKAKSPRKSLSLQIKEAWYGYKDYYKDIFLNKLENIRLKEHSFKGFKTNITSAMKHPKKLFCFLFYKF